MKIHIYSDPGHAWGKVKKSFLVKLGIADKITTYSYMRGDYAYLEEDCDLSTLVHAMRQSGMQVEFIETNCRNRQSRIRNYQYYKAQP